MNTNLKKGVSYMTKKQQNAQLFKSMKTTEFWIGLFIVAVFAGVVGGFFNRKVKNNLGGITTRQVISPSVQPTVENKPTTTVTKNSNHEIKKITHLANTAGAYIAVEGDNYYRISKKVCGTGKFYLSIQAKNNDKPLHPGTEVIAECVE